MAQTRQLAAIMFTDIVGYSVLMGDDEQKAFNILKKNRHLQKKIIDQHNGRWVKEIGGGVLARFNSASDAVNAAINIQRASIETNEFRLRVGIHLGEVVLEDDDVFGDGVNIASRLQTSAPVGGIWISEVVYKNIANKKSINTAFVRNEKLKNVKDPVRIYEVVPASTGSSNLLIKKFGRTPTRKLLILFAGVVLVLLAGYFTYYAFRIRPTSSKTGQWENSIAVLPFVNISDDREQEYFSDGLTEELLNLLAKTPGLKVIARTSAFAFKNKKEDVRTIGEKLDVDHILEGSVQKSGNQIRIKAFLVNTSDGKQIWNETFVRQLTDIFKVQDEIASAVVNQLNLKFFGRGIHSTSNPEVLNLIMQGNYFLARLDETNVLKAMIFMKRPA